VDEAHRAEDLGDFTAGTPGAAPKIRSRRFPRKPNGQRFIVVISRSHALTM
jgi:hypothetical protein